MQIIGLPRQFNGAARLASRLSAKPSICEARRRDALGRWRRARNAGLTAAQAADAIGVPVSTLYRWAKQPVPKSRAPHTRRKRTWRHETIREVERLRNEHPMWGKAKIGPILRKAGHGVSDSTVGRILGYLVGRKAIRPVPTARRAARRRKSVEGRYARRWTGNLRADRPGDLVQFDTLTVRPAPGMTVKQFTAYDPKSRFTVAQAFTRATSRAAGRFLGKVVDALPFPVRAIQVDGGSEFMAEFEKACRAREIVLYVLPPRSPKLNGGVERANGTWRREFWECEDLPDDLPGINAGIDGFADLYNHRRPHGALKGRTPAEYLETIAESGNPESLN